MILKKKKQKFYFDLGTYSIKASSDKSENIIYDSGLIKKGGEESTNILNEEFAIDFKYSQKDELINIKRGFSRGRIVNNDIARAVIKRITHKLKINSTNYNTAIVSIIDNLDLNDQQNLTKVFDASGFSKVIFVKESIAQSLGALGRITKDSVYLTVHVGYLKTSINLVSDHANIRSYQLDLGLNNIINEMIDSIKLHENLEISYVNAKEFLDLNADLFPSHAKVLEIVGKSAGGIAKINLNVIHIKNATRTFADKLIKKIIELRLDLSSGLVDNITSNGICFSGGIYNLANLSKYVTKNLDIPCFIAEDPVNTIVRGLKYF